MIVDVRHADHDFRRDAILADRIDPRVEVVRVRLHCQLPKVQPLHEVGAAIRPDVFVQMDHLPDAVYAAFAHVRLQDVLKDIPRRARVFDVDRPALCDRARADRPAGSLEGEFQAGARRLCLRCESICEFLLFQFLDVQLRDIPVLLRPCLDLLQDVFVFLRPDVVFRCQRRDRRAVLRI